MALAPFGDQRLARERAANYFALFDVFKKQDIVEELWSSVVGSLDAPFAVGIAGEPRTLGYG